MVIIINIVIITISICVGCQDLLLDLATLNYVEHTTESCCISSEATVVVCLDRVCMLRPISVSRS